MLAARLAPCVALLIAVPVLSAPAAAGDPLAAEFKKAAKIAVSAVKLQSKLSTKEAKVELKVLSGDYGKGLISASTALQSSTTVMTTRRDELADSAFVAISALAADGVALLIEAEVTEPGADFQAGGRGHWDDALDDIEAAMDKADAKFAKVYAKFVKDMGKGAKKQDEVIDVRWHVPEHGDDFWSELPPLPVEPIGLGAESIEFEPPQVLIEARFVVTGQDQELSLGVRFDGASADVVASSEAGEALTLGTLSFDTDGVATGNFGLTGLANQASFIGILVQTLTDKSHLEALSAPRLTESDVNGEITSGFQAGLKGSKQALAGACAEALKNLSQLLDSHVEAVTKDLAGAELAIQTGFGNLRDAREDMSSALLESRATAVEILVDDLVDGGFDDADLPPDFAPDAIGLYTDAAGTQADKLKTSQDEATKRFDKFMAKILKLAKKKDQLIGANSVIGRTRRIATPMITTAAMPPDQESSPTYLTDGLVLRVTPAIGPDDFSVMLIIQTDAVLHPLVDLSAVTVPDGDTLVLGGVSARPGGTQQTEVPILGDLPVLGWLFGGKSSAETHDDLLVIIKPQIVTDA